MTATNRLRSQARTAAVAVEEPVLSTAPMQCQSNPWYCQQASGTAYATVAVVPKTAVQIRGEPRYHKTVGQAGKTVERGFCPSCGSPAIVKLERLPDDLALLAGTMHLPFNLRWMHLRPARSRGIICTQSHKSIRTAYNGNCLLCAELPALSRPMR